jgi:4-amino-4-deoxy-L-arabinose transferase-like glycosyltransferase
LLARGSFTVGGVPQLERTPGYPLLLAVGLWSGQVLAVTIAIQVVLSALTTFGVFVVARAVTSDARSGLIAATVYAFEPISIEGTSAISTESLFTFIVVWGIALIVTYVRAPKLTALLGGTALLSCAAYVRPAGYYLSFGLLAFLALVRVAARDWRRLSDLALAGAVAVAIVLPWHVRNRALDFRGFSSVSAVNMYFYNAAAVEARLQGRSYADVQTAWGYRDGSVYLALHPEQATWSPGRRFTYMSAEGTRIVKSNLLLYARIHAAGMLRVAFDPGALSLLRSYGLYEGNSGVLSVIVTNGLVAGIRQILQTNLLGFVSLGMFGVALVVVYALALRGWLGDRRALDPAVLLLVLSVAYFIIIAGGPVGVGRFRHPAMPFVCVLAAMGLDALWRKRRGEARPSHPA